MWIRFKIEDDGFIQVTKQNTYLILILYDLPIFNDSEAATSPEYSTKKPIPVTRKLKQDISAILCDPTAK